MPNTADRISERMIELGLQHKDLVVLSGASKGTVTNWISGVNEPTGKRLIALADALKTTPDYLLTFLSCLYGSELSSGELGKL